MPTAIRNFILATAGHVDHGKSAIVRALTGTDPDRLPEEKARGITIDLGFAHFELKTPELTYRFGVIDVPGHEDFVHNMVAGVGSVDVALLVVAADDGWMPQTEEHLQILEYQGVTRGVVAVNKIDLAVDRDAVLREVRARLAGSALADVPVVMVSAFTGEGIDALKLALIDVLRSVPQSADIRKPRLHVDRTFTVAGAGTIVTGTLVGGQINRGQKIVVQPAGKAAKVRAVQTHNRDVATAVPGSRTALNLPELRLGERATVRRGDTVTVDGLGGASKSIDVVLTRSDRVPDARPLRSGTPVYVHIGTAALVARVVLFQRKSLAPGERSIAQLRFEQPAYVFIGDRLILRDAPQRHTLAGGIVLDARSNSVRWMAEPRAKLLLARAAALSEVAILVKTEIDVRRALPEAELLTQSNFSAEQIRDAIPSDTIRRNNWLVAPAAWHACLAAAAALITDEVQSHPEKLGMASTDLHSAIRKSLPSDELFDALLADLEPLGFVRRGATVMPKAHRPALPESLRAAGARVLAALSDQPLEPPNRNVLTPTSADAQALRFLIDSGQAVVLNDELVLTRDALDHAADAVRNHLQKHGPASASELKAALGTTRRVMIPLLEWLDQHGVTRRVGDKRVAITNK